MYFVQKNSNNNKKLLQGDKIEDPKYVIENNLEIDYLHYITNQIMKPSLKFLELIADNPNKIFNHYIEKEQERIKNNLINNYRNKDSTINDDNNYNNDDNENDCFNYDEKTNKKITNDKKTNNKKINDTDGKASNKSIKNKIIIEF